MRCSQKIRELDSMITRKDKIHGGVMVEVNNVTTMTNIQMSSEEGSTHIKEAEEIIETFIMKTSTHIKETAEIKNYCDNEWS